MKSITVKQLKQLVASIDKHHDDQEIRVWLPGSRILLSQSIIFGDGEVLIEGNVKPGSALDA